MPIYEYRCQICDERFERLVPMSAASAPAVCPTCGSPDTRKQFSTFATTIRSSSSSANAGTACAPSGG